MTNRKMMAQQTDLFGDGPAQPDMFADHRPGVIDWSTWRPDPSVVRGKLHTMLNEAKAASHCSPWDERETRVNRTIFRQMANWLPQEEADQLRSAFVLELERLGAA